jgi:hypothetical protein
VKILFALFKWVLIIVAILVLCLGALVFLADREQDAAKSSASSFCTLAEIGADLSASIARAQSAGVKRHYPWCDAKRYVFFFQGSTFNGFDCVLSVDSGKVTAKSVIERLDEDPPDKVCK